jgi:hypothetical protein
LGYLGIGAWRGPLGPLNRERKKGKPTAFDDTQLGDWLIELVADGSGDFLCALAEAVVMADAVEYAVVRPALIELKRRHDLTSGARK